MILDLLLYVLIFFAGTIAGILVAGLAQSASRADYDSEAFAKELKIMELERELDRLSFSRGWLEQHIEENFGENGKSLMKQCREIDENKFYKGE